MHLPSEIQGQGKPSALDTQLLQPWFFLWVMAKVGVNPTSHYFRLGAVEGCHHFHHWNRCHSFLPLSLSLTSSFCCDPSLTLGFAVMGYSATLLTFPPKNYMTSTQTSTTMQTCMPLERFFSSHLFLLLSFLDFFLPEDEDREDSSSWSSSGCGDSSPPSHSMAAGCCLLP